MLRKSTLRFRRSEHLSQRDLWRRAFNEIHPCSIQGPFSQSIIEPLFCNYMGVLVLGSVKQENIVYVTINLHLQTAVPADRTSVVSDRIWHRYSICNNHLFEQLAVLRA